MTFQNNFFNPDGSRYSPKVSDLLTPEPLGYTYVETPIATVSLTGVPTELAVRSNKFTALWAMPNGAARPAGIASYSASVTQPAATIAKYLEIPVDVDAAALAPVAARPSLPSGFETLSLAAARQHYLNGPRCFAILRDFDVGQNTNIEYRVFLNCDYLSASTPTTDRHYVGSFGFFGAHAHGGGVRLKKPSIGVDLTTVICGLRPLGDTARQVAGADPAGRAAAGFGKADGSAKPATSKLRWSRRDPTSGLLAAQRWDQGYGCSPHFDDRCGVRACDLCPDRGYLRGGRPLIATVNRPAIVTAAPAKRWRALRPISPPPASLFTSPATSPRKRA